MTVITLCTTTTQRAEVCMDYTANKKRKQLGDRENVNV